MQVDLGDDDGVRLHCVQCVVPDVSELVSSGGLPPAWLFEIARHYSAAAAVALTGRVDGHLSRPCFLPFAKCLLHVFLGELLIQQFLNLDVWPDL